MEPRAAKPELRSDERAYALLIVDPMKNLVLELENDILNPTTDLSTILRRAMVLASLLRQRDFKIWVEKELNGYTWGTDEIPGYRKFDAQNFGTFLGPGWVMLSSQPIPLSHIPPEVRKHVESQYFIEGVRHLEGLVGSESGMLAENWDADILAYCSTKIIPEYQCIRAWKESSASRVAQILDTVRTRLLSVVLELKEQYPEVETSNEAIAAIPESESNAIINTYIFGDNATILSGAGNTQKVTLRVVKNDLDSLRLFLSQQGVLPEELADLESAVHQDGVPKSPNAFGRKVAGWIGKVTARLLESAAGPATGLIVEAVKKYYGWN